MTTTELQQATAADTAASGPPARQAARVYAPRVDILETDEDLFLYADLPGVRPEDVSLNCKGDQLILHARCHPRHPGGTAIHAEYGVGDYYRAFTVTEQVDWSGIEASLADGVLTVRLPKAEAVRPKRIPVKGG
jgi:HSP20 family protein